MATRVVQALAVLSLAWGVLAFGSTYEWASNPLAIGCAATGLLAWLVVRGGPGKFFLFALALVAIAISLQLIALPAATVNQFSPQTLGVVTKLDVLYSTQRGSHPLSIFPPATWHALALFGGFAMLAIGVARLLSKTGTAWLCWSLTVLGVLLALFGIIQSGVGNGKIYGFWTTEQGGTGFGPFVNRNHFAGWMLMALPLTLALLCAGIARGLRHVRPTFRDRFLWLGSPDASKLILLGGGAAVMGLALVMTMSRSGILAFILAIAITGRFVIRGVSTGTARSVARFYLVGLVILVAAWVGVDAIVNRFSEAQWDEYNSRVFAWADARDIGSRFALTGTGLNTYGVATMFFQQHELYEHYVQAHNDYLQLFAEGGLLLTIPAGILVLAIATMTRKRFREDAPRSSAWWARAGAVTGLVSIALQETVDFSLQMPGNAALFAVLVAIAVHEPRHKLPPAATQAARLAS